MIDQTGWVMLVVCLLALLVNFLLIRIQLSADPKQKKKKGMLILTIIMQLLAALSAWRFLYGLIKAAFPSQRSGLLIPAQLIAFASVLLIIIVVAIIVRKRIIPRYQMQPKGVQSLMEALVSRVHGQEKKEALAAMSPEELNNYLLLRLEKRRKRRRRFNIVAIAGSLWLILCLLIREIFPPIKRTMEFQLLPGNIQLGPFTVPETLVSLWVLTLIILTLLVLLRIFVLPKFNDQKPSALQQGLEMAVDGVQNYAKKMSDVDSPLLAKYIFGLTAFLFFSATTDFFGIRPPTTDLRLTGLLALLTFIMFNYYGLKKKGLKGRLKALASPSPIILPIRVLSDLASPISLACRLFGNMVGGMIVMELIYVALGNFAIGIPSVLGLYFSVFEPLIQIYIFITLSLNYIREASE